jgi:serine/threonine protein kinase
MFPNISIQLSTHLISHLSTGISKEFHIDKPLVRNFINEYFDLQTILTYINYNSTTKDELYNLAVYYNISVTKKNTKQELFDILNESLFIPYSQEASVRDDTVSGRQPHALAHSQVAAEGGIREEGATQKDVYNTKGSSKNPSLKKYEAAKKNLHDQTLTGVCIHSKKNNVWTFGEKIGHGSFGNVYKEASDQPPAETAAKRQRPNESSQNNLIIKQGGGNVYYEINVLKRLLPTGCETSSKACKNPRKFLDDRSVPLLIDSGKITENSYFIVMPNYGISLQNILKTESTHPLDLAKDLCPNAEGVAGPKAPPSGASRLQPFLINQMVIQLLEAFSYLNEKQYLHLDVKPANILCSNFNRGVQNKPNQSFYKWCLIDYGLAKKFHANKFEIDSKSKRTGSLRYMARDAHIGLMSRKCDLESLVYTIIECDGVQTPWYHFKKKEHVEILKSKEIFFDSIKLRGVSLRKKSPVLRCFDKFIPKTHLEFFRYVDQLKPDDIPDYLMLQQMVSA